MLLSRCLFISDRNADTPTWQLHTAVYVLFPHNYYYYYYYYYFYYHDKCQDLSDAITTIAGALYKVYQ